ncbi:ribonuclease H family protein [Prauserella rugosa]|uniref:Ribonuclease H n=1 Tax=Prauserella rugosa TaxID=43354 RepID=A0A660C8A7_9PSEU|nr:ribonuclease H [Prauserella rugosa]TWH15963.1 ribonuclease HI [Prauserella rugosa]
MAGLVIAATDGAAQPNPGPAGWAWIIGDDQGRRPVRGASGYLGSSTNNVGELTAVEQLLQATDPAVPLEVRIDSQYAMNAVTTWLPNQRRRGYRTAAGKPIANRELIVRIDELLTGRSVRFVYVRAHQVDGDPLNAAADHAAQDAVRSRRGWDWTGEELAALAVLSTSPPAAAARTSAPPRAAQRAGTGRCAATTKAGKPCPIDPRPSGWCHVHDPAVQCGAVTAKGRPCTVATGGGRCAQHRTS